MTWGSYENNQIDINKLIRDIETDHEWVKFVTELGVNEARWKKQPDNSRLLSGKKLQEAEQHLANLGSKKSPQPTVIQREYVKASRKAEQNRTKTITGIATSVSIILCLLCVLTIVGGSMAYVQNNVAVEKELARATAQDTAFSRELAIVAQGIDTQSYENMVLRTLLSIESLRRSPTSPLAIENIHGLPLPIKINSVSFSDTLSYDRVTILDGVFSEQRKQVLVAGYYYEIYSNLRIWNLETGELVAEWDCPYKIESAKFSKDGGFIAIVCEDEIISIFDITKDDSSFFSYKSGNIYAFDFDSSIPRIFIDKSDGLDFWINGINNEIFFLKDSENMSGLELSHDGTIIAGISSDSKTICIWDVNTGDLKLTIVANDRFHSFALSHNSQFLVTGGDNSISVWSLITGEKQDSFSFDTVWQINDLQVSPDDKKIGVASSGGFASVIDIMTGEIILGTSMNNPGDISFNKESQLVAVSGRDGVTKVANLLSGEVVSTFLSSARSVDGLQFSKDSSQLLVMEYDDASLWNISRLGVVSEKITDTQALIAPPVADVLIIIDNAGTIILKSSLDDRVLGEIEGINDIDILTASQLGKYIAIAKLDGNIEVWDVTSKKRVFETNIEDIGLLYEIKEFIFFKNEGKLLIKTQNQIVAIELSGGKQLYEIFSEGLGNIIFSPDEEKFAVSSTLIENGSGNTCLYNTDLGNEIFCTSSPSSNKIFSDNGEFIYLDNANENEINIWNTKTGEKVQTFPSLSGSMLLGPDSILVVTSNNYTPYTASVTMIDISKNIEVFRTTRNSTIESIKFNEDFSRLITLENYFRFDPDKEIFITTEWLWQSSDLIKDACQRVYRNLTFQEWGKYLPSESYRATCEHLPQPQQ